jgi:copper chaperone CopZ
MAYLPRPAGMSIQRKLRDAVESAEAMNAPAVLGRPLLIALLAGMVAVNSSSLDRVYVLDISPANCVKCRNEIKDKLEDLDGVRWIQFEPGNYLCKVTMQGTKTLTAKMVQDVLAGTRYVLHSIQDSRN